MDFQNNKNIIIALSVSVALASILYISNSGEAESEASTQASEVTKEKKIKEIEILYLNDETTKAKSTEKPDVITREKLTKEESPRQKYSKMDFSEEGSIEAFIKEKALIDLSKNNTKQAANPPQHTIYATINTKEAYEKRDNSIPPPAPVFFTVTSNSGEQYSGVVDAEVLKQGEVYISKNNPMGTPEDLVNVSKQLNNDEPQEEMKIIAPPSVGQ